MKLTPTLAAATLGVAALSSAFLVTGSATAGQQPSATGGGQTAVGDRGAGDTIAFTARGTGEDVSGQVQYVDRADGTGKGQTVLHGTVTCLEVMGNAARLGGEWRDGGAFSVYVQDNGNGDGTDMIAVSERTTPDCSSDEGDDSATALARGNAQVRSGE